MVVLDIAMFIIIIMSRREACAAGPSNVSRVRV
jgi:hypothetical protein